MDEIETDISKRILSLLEKHFGREVSKNKPSEI